MEDGSISTEGSRSRSLAFCEPEARTYVAAARMEGSSCKTLLATEWQAHAALVVQVDVSCTERESWGGRV
eukprot:2703992-Pyramimonas_sp.AAC.1